MSNISDSLLPLVSICTPTFNRRPFIPYMIKCFDHQTYPKDRMEWIIIDDGTDKVGDLLIDHPNIKYFSYNEKMPLGEKRNLMHDKCKGDIIIYMDDDDYYPSERVSHAVEMLQNNPDKLCAGSSIINIYYEHIDKIYQFGPYGPNHATAGTFAFRKEMLENRRYVDSMCIAEEKFFLDNYTVPLIQLDPTKVILVFAHDHNSVDKRILLDNLDSRFGRIIDTPIEELVPETDLLDFYKVQLKSLLSVYEPGKPYNKPDVLKNISMLEENRKKDFERRQKENANAIICKQSDGTSITITPEQLVKITQQQLQELQNTQQQIKHLKNCLEEKDIENKYLTGKMTEIINNSIKKN